MPLALIHGRLINRGVHMVVPRLEWMASLKEMDGRLE